MSSSDRVKYFLVEEATPGVTPASAAFEALRITGESLKSNYEYDQSKELRADRTEPEQIIIAANTSGNLNIELLTDAHHRMLAAVCGQNAWTGTTTKTLKNGVVGKTYSILKQFSDLTDVNHLFKGVVINSFNVNIQKKAIVTGAFGVMGRNMVNGAIGTILSGTPTYAAASASDPLNGSSHITALKMNNVAMTTGIDSASFSIVNNYRSEERLGNLNPTGHTQGRIVVTGSMDLYFKTDEEYNYYASGTPFSWEAAFRDNDGDDISFLFDRCKFEDMEVVAGGTSQDIIAKGKWRATYDPTNDRLFQITWVNN